MKAFTVTLLSVFTIASWAFVGTITGAMFGHEGANAGGTLGLWVGGAQCFYEISWLKRAGRI